MTNAPAPTLVSEAAAAPCEWIAERKLDVALVAGETKPGPRVRIEPLFRDELVALVGRDHPWFTRREVDVRAFADEHVWADDTAFHRDTPLGCALEEAGDIMPRKVTSIPTMAGVPMEMARANLGITIMPRWTVEPALAEGDLHAVRITPRGLWLEWSVATRAEPPEPALVPGAPGWRAPHRVPYASTRLLPGMRCGCRSTSSRRSPTASWVCGIRALLLR